MVICFYRLLVLLQRVTRDFSPRCTGEAVPALEVLLVMTVCRFHGGHFQRPAAEVAGGFFRVGAACVHAARVIAPYSGACC